MAQIIGLAIGSPWKASRNLLRVLIVPVVWIRLRCAGVELGKRGRYFGTPVVRRHRGSTIRIGSDVEMRSWPLSNVLGLSHRVILTTLCKEAVIEISDNVGISGATIAALKSIRIGAGTLLGADVLITDTDHHTLAGERRALSLEGVAAAPIDIGRNVFIGARAIILKGARIGDWAVIGAGAVVTTDVPEKAIFAGNPARLVGWNR